MLGELYRVLKPGACIYAVFTPFYGALSHHFNYVTRLPGIHWIFSSTLLVEAANDILSSKYGKSLGAIVVGVRRA
jgi:hypothetical protein